MVSQGNTNIHQLYVDGVLVFSGPASVNTSNNGFGWGGVFNNADVDWDYIRFTQPAPFDHFLCYEVKVPRGEPKFVPLDVDLADQFQVTLGSVKKPTMVCTPVDKNGEGIGAPENHLTCYEIKTSGPKFSPVDVMVTDQFGEQVLTIKKPKYLCAPSIKEHLDD